ncbi:MAG: type I 3-dehydroquinate dehydratase [Vicinamibacterales bacterium]
MKSKPLAVATVTAPTMAELRRDRDAIEGADMVELRLDFVRDIDVAGALEGCRVPAIVTCRARWEGGAFDGSEEERHRILAEAIERGAAYVDIEWRAGFEDIVGRRGGRGVVLSMHDFDGVPADLQDIEATMRRTGAEVVKIAVAASSLGDCLPLLDLARRNQARTPEAGSVFIAMGESGWATRMLAAKFGSRWTYAGRAAPGQVSLDRLLREFRYRSVGFDTAVYGVVGSSVAHSLSPAMHNAAFAALGIDAVYVPLRAASSGDFFSFAEAIQLRGASVTAPFKTDLAARVNGRDRTVARLGALNTIRATADGWAGINTDVAGFLAPLAHRIDLAGRRVAILGSGGAARAVAAALAGEGAHVSVFARNPEKARAVASLAGGAAFSGLPARGSWDLLVNATPVGTSPAVDETLVPQRDLGGDTGRLVYDLVYNPRETRLLRDAAAAGCETVGGLDMLVAQAELQFEWWTGRRAPDSVMRSAALAALAGS